MKEALVIGIGNRLMMDDGIGVRVVETLIRRNTNHMIQYVVGETDVSYCLQKISEVPYIIIVDAARLGNKPGGVTIMPLQQVLENLSQSISAHESNFLNEIKLTGKNSEGIFIGIEPYEINYSMSLSSVIQERFLTIVHDIENIVKTYVG